MLSFSSRPLVNMEDIVSNDPRDAFLLMLNERVGALETQMHSIHEKLDILLNQFHVVSTDCVLITLGLPSEVSTDNWFKPETDGHMAKLIYDAYKCFEIEKIYIEHFSCVFDTYNASKDLTVYIKLKKPLVYVTIEPMLKRFDTFKDSRGCYIKHHNSSSNSMVLSAYHRNPNRFSVFEY